MTQSFFRRSRLSFVAVTAVASLVLVACGSSSSGGSGGGGGGGGETSTTAGEYGTLPPASPNKVAGGTITFPIENGSQPTYIFPITPGNDSSIYDVEYLQYLLWRPLYWTPVGNRPVINEDLSLADLPTYSNGNKTVTINLKSAYKWSDGKPVTANDLIFYIDEVRAAVKENPSNYSNYSKGSFPDNIVSATAPSPSQLVLTMDRAYNPSWVTDTQLNLLSPLPSTALKGIRFSTPYLPASSWTMPSISSSPSLMPSSSVHWYCVG